LFILKRPVATALLFSTKVPSKREREQEKDVQRKFPKIPGATSISGTRIFETEHGNDKVCTIVASYWLVAML